MHLPKRFLCPISLLLLSLTAVGCPRSTGPSVVVYTALDSEFSEPLLQEFETTSGIDVLPKFDVESTKTVGLTQALLAEAKHPRCDVFWNNEVLNTIRLERAGLLDAYIPQRQQHFPPQTRDAENRWHGLAARLRVLLVNTDLLSADDFPTSVLDLADERYRGRTAIAKPLFGTTATHAACLYAVLGPDQAEDFFLRLKANDTQILSGNKQVAQAVSAGRIAFGLTDTDDAIIEVEAGHPVAIVIPDQGPDQMGALHIPNTLAILKNCPHPNEARQLVDYLLSPKVEQTLANGPSAQIPLADDVNDRSRALADAPEKLKMLDVDFHAAADHWDQAGEFLRKKVLEGE